MAATKPKAPSKPARTKAEQAVDLFATFRYRDVAEFTALLQERIPGLYMQLQHELEEDPDEEEG